MNLKDMAQGIGVTVVEPADSPRQAIFDDHERVVNKFNILVSSIRTLLEHESKPIIHFPVSQGKDSTLCELAGLEAYRQCIAEGTIESERPMILSTVDTKVEQTPMRMYVRYCKSRIEDYAQKCGINLDYQLVMPNLTSEYFVKWAGAQKIIGNASRNGDCSVILKIDPNTKHLRTLSDEYPGYERSHFISVVGSRHEESSRRSANIKKSSMVESAEDLFDGMETESVGGTVIHSFAGIADWTTDEVFLALHLAGDQPKTAYQGKRGTTVIPSFLPHHELLVEIYGNGSNETCSISTGSKGGSGCNGKSRFGCSTCTYTGFTDKSSEALTAYPRWHALGAEKALRLRDYLFRLSTDMEARAFHARSIDPVTFNRVLLQPNVLKGRYLTKMIRYASQLTVDGEAAAQVMRDHVANGTTAEHPGVQDIQNDPTMSDNLKAAFLEMYIEGAQENQFPYFSTKHAAMLSFRYAVDGVALPPYTPLAIWRDTVMGVGRIPYPKLNREGVDKAKYGLSNPLPEAIALRTLKEESVKEFAQNPVDFLDYWERPFGVLDLFDSEYDCSKGKEPYHQQMMRFKYQLDFYVGDRPFPGAVGHFSYTQGSDEQVLSVVTMRLDTHTLPKNIDKRFGDRMKAEMRDIALKQLSKDLSEYITNYQGTLTDALSKAQRQFGTQTIEQVLPYMSQEQWSTGVQAEPRKTKDRQQFTKRVTKVTSKGIQRGNTRLLFYRPQLLSRLTEAHQVTTPFLKLNFLKRDHVEMPLQGDPVRYNQDLNELDNIDVDWDAFQHWMLYGGMKKALAEYDSYVSDKIKNRESLYRFPGTNAAHELLRNSGVHVKRGYKSQLTDLLKRTEIMDSMGAFDFQNWSFEKLKAYPYGTFTMSEHRKDKAKVMLEIRAQRNLSRRETRAQLSMSKPELGLQCFKTHWPQFIREVQQVAQLYVHAGYTSAVEMAYNFDDVNLATKAQSARLWLDMHQSKLSNLPSLFELTMGKALSKALLNSPSHLAQANALITNELPALIETVTSAKDVWHPLLTNLRTQLPEWRLQAEQAPSTVPGLHKAFYDVVSTLHPTAEILPFSVWGINDCFRPRAPVFALKMGLKLAKIDQIDAWVKGLETDVDLTLRKLKRPVTQNLSLADRMRALKN